MIAGSSGIPKPNRSMRPLLLLLLFSHPAIALGGIAVRFDLENGRAELSGVGGEWRWDVDPTALAEALPAFQAALVLGEWDDQLAKTLGSALLGPAAAVLDTASVWMAEPVDVAPLDALILPGRDQPIGRTATVGYLPHRAATGSPPRGGLLVVDPFIPGNDNASDDPYIFYEPMRREVRSNALIPRDDATPNVVAAILGDEPVGLIWVRSTPAQARAFLPALRRGPPLLLWTRSEEELATCPLDRATALEVCVGWAEGGGAIVADLWPVDESDRAPAMGRWVAELTRGATGFDAYRRARRLLVESRPVPEWAGWIHVGDPATLAQLPPPTWWQRLWQR